MMPSPPLIFLRRRRSSSGHRTVSAGQTAPGPRARIGPLCFSYIVALSRGAQGTMRNPTFARRTAGTRGAWRGDEPS